MPTAEVSPCPKCRVVGNLGIAMRLVADPPGTYSIAGAQTKVTAWERPVLECGACGLYVVGAIEDGHAVFRPLESHDGTEPAAGRASPDGGSPTR